MIPAVSDGLGTQMILILVLKAQSAHMRLSCELFLQPLTDQLVPSLEPVFAYVVEHSLFDIDVEGQILFRDMRIAKLGTLCFVADNAHILVNHQLVWHRVFDKIAADKFPDVLPFLGGDAHQGFLFRVRKEHIADDAVPVVMPCAQLLHVSVTSTFP